jgi:hypothetical protein
MKNLSAFLLVVFLTSSCGFHSIYNIENDIPGEVDERSYKQELAAIKIVEKRKYINQQLRNNLEVVLNPDEIKNEPKYLLNVDLTKTLTSTFTTTTGASGRNKVTLTADYQLKDIATGKVISIGSTTARDDFDVQSRRFANYNVEEAIAVNLTKIIAQNIRNLLMSDILNKNKQKDEDSDIVENKSDMNK